MSDALYPTRLRWCHTAGLARCDDVQLVLREVPVLPGLAGLTEIDYAPHIVAQVRIGAEAMRDMSHDERHDAMALLQAMARCARDEVEGGRTLAMVFA